MKRRQGLQTVVLLAGLAGLTMAIVRTVEDSRDQVLPSGAALIIASLFAAVAITTSGRAWVALFHDLVAKRADRLRLEGAYFLSQLTKYLPAGGVVQVASQVGLSTSTGVPLGRVALAFPVSGLSSVAAGCSLGAGLAIGSELPGWGRAVALLGLTAPAFLHRQLMAHVLGLARRAVRRIPNPDRLPSQHCILASYGWAVVSIGAAAAGYTVLLQSITTGTNTLTLFFGYAVAWTVGFLIVPVPAGVGVREAVLVAVVPGVAAAPLLAASLAQRLLSIGAELTVVLANKLLRRRQLLEQAAPQTEEIAARLPGHAGET